jgi:DedD protein
VLVLIGVVGFPLVFDTQPRPIAVDLPIDIPDRNKARPLSLPTPSAAVASQSKPVAAVPAAAPAPAAAAVAPVVPASVAKAEPAPPVAAPKPEARVEAKAEPKPEPKVAAKPDTRADDGARARALLEGAAVDGAAAAGPARFVVQVGAFADPDKARETRQKVERAGLKTYVHVAETREGKRTRVRVGPFGSREEADKAASRIKGLDLPAAVLTL